MAKEYIDREVVKNAITADGYEHFSGCLSSSEIRLLELMLDSVSEIPAEDVTEVVHGRWISASKKQGVNIGMKCSLCGARIKNSEFFNGNHNYCHKCGAKMDGGE